MPVPTTCPGCGVAASGRFCADCGAALGGATCGGCRSALSAGARFCHRCGTPVGEGAPRAGAERGLAGALPWAVAAIALLALVALVAGQRFGRSRPAGEAAAVASEGMAPSGAPGGMSPTSPIPAPDISSLTPEQRADRLFNLIMTRFEEGDTARVAFLAPMALQAFQQLPSMTPDQRYHLGRIGAVTGVVVLAAAQADTILRAEPAHLLGLLLAAQAARMRDDENAARSYDRRLLDSRSVEEAKRRPEYVQHANDIARAVETARGRSRA